MVAMARRAKDDVVIDGKNMDNRFKDAAEAAGLEILGEHLGVAGWEYRVKSKAMGQDKRPLYHSPAFEDPDDAWKRACTDNGIIVEAAQMAVTGPENMMNSITQTASVKLPFDQGTAAYDQRKHWRENPYAEGTWEHEEWDDGWCMGEEADGKSFDWIGDRFKQ